MSPKRKRHDRNRKRRGNVANAQKKGKNGSIAIPTEDLSTKSEVTDSVTTIESCQTQPTEPKLGNISKPNGATQAIDTPNENSKTYRHYKKTTKETIEITDGIPESRPDSDDKTPSVRREMPLQYRFLLAILALLLGGTPLSEEARVAMWKLLDAFADLFTALSRSRP